MTEKTGTILMTMARSICQKISPEIMDLTELTELHTVSMIGVRFRPAGRKLELTMQNMRFRITNIMMPMES